MGGARLRNRTRGGESEQEEVMADGLEKRRLGKTGLDVTVFGFGCIKFPHISGEQAAAALDHAIDLGVNFIDTARGYGDSEVKIGPVLKRRLLEEFGSVARIRSAPVEVLVSVRGVSRKLAQALIDALA